MLHDVHHAQENRVGVQFRCGTTVRRCANCPELESDPIFLFSLPQLVEASLGTPTLK